PAVGAVAPASRYPLPIDHRPERLDLAAEPRPSPSEPFRCCGARSGRCWGGSLAACRVEAASRPRQKPGNSGRSGSFQRAGYSSLDADPGEVLVITGGADLVG